MTACWGPAGRALERVNLGVKTERSGVVVLEKASKGVITFYLGTYICSPTPSGSLRGSLHVRLGELLP